MEQRPDFGETTYRGHGRLTGRVALVTGADSGIGRAVALAFAREGADVAIAYLEEHEDARETESWVTKAGRRALVMDGDVGDPEVCEASIQAYKPSPGILDDASTKGAIRTFTQGLAQELTSKGIRVNAVAPGPVWTPLIQQSFSAEEVKTFGESSPLGRPAQPAEIAPAYVFLASDEGQYVSGEVLGVTGGKPLA